MDCFEVKRIQPEGVTAAPSSSSKSDNIQKRNNQNNGITGTNGNQGETVSKAVPLTTPEDFLCLDFTVDLDIACDKRGTLRLFATVQCSTVQYCKVQCSTVKYSTWCPCPRRRKTVRVDVRPLYIPKSNLNTLLQIIII